MSEFVVFIELISTVITRIIKLIFELLEFSWNVVTNAIAFAIYCTMQFLPWKNYECSLMYPTEVFTSMRFLPSSWDSSNDYYTYDIRDVAFEQFTNLLFDLLLFMPSFCIILLNPLEYYNLGVVWRKYSNNPVNETYYLYFFNTKYGLVEGALRSLFGIFTLLFVPFIFLNPYRLWMYLNVVPRLWERRCDTVNKLKQGLDRSQIPLTHIYDLNIMMGVYSVVDIFVIVPTVCIVSCIPSLWYCFFGGIYECYVKDNSRKKYLTIIDNEVYNITLDEPPTLSNKVVRRNINILLYAFCGVQYYHAFVDIISIPLTIMALLSPLRHSALRSALHEITAVETESARTKEYHLNPLVVAPPGDIDFSTYRYSYESRVSGMTFGFLSILDFFLLPFLIPLWLTWYRWSPVHDQLRLVRVWNFNEVLVVLRQSSYLAADVMILLFLVPIIYVTRYRWKPVQVALELSDGVSPDKTLGVHFTVVKTIIFMLLDVLTAPILVLILVTWYRSHSVYVYFSRENYFHLNLAYHVQMLSEFLILIHDACIIMPVLIVTSVLSPWRLPLILSLVKYQATTSCCAWTHQSRETGEDNNLYNVATSDMQGGNTPPPTETIPLNADDSLSNLSSYREPEELLHHGDTCCCFSETESRWRCHVYILLLQIFVDWPILLMSSIIVSTVWRIGTTCIAIKKVIADNHRYRFYYYHHDEFSEYMILEGNAKWEVVKQFCLLLRDIFFLIPFSIIVATVYRLPFLLIDLISRLAADPSPDANPLFEVVECKVDYPEKAAPLISLQLLPSYMDNSHNNYKYSNNLKIESAKLFVSGQSFWDTCSATLGPSIVGIAKTLLPLKLVNDKSIGISEFNGQIVEATSILPLWIRLDSLSKVKRSSVLKKLHKLSSYVDMEVQVEGAVEYEVDGKVVRENKVLFRFKVAISDIINALESSAPFPVRGFSPFVPSVDTSEGGIVDSFYAVVAMHFFYLATDLRYILQLLVIALAPWRFVSLFYYLLEPIENNASSIRSGLLQCINDAGLHLISYRREIAVPLNELTKEISSSASNGKMYNTYALWRAVDSFTNMRLDHQVEEIESVDLQSFIFLYKFMLKLCTVYEDLGDFLPLLENRLKLYNDMLSLHFIKQSLLQSLYLESVYQRKERLEDGRDAVSVLMRQKMIHLVKSLNENKQAIIKNIDDHNVKRIPWSWKKMGMFKRSLNETRAIISYNFFSAINDIYYSVGALFVLLSVFKTVPFVAAMDTSIRQKGLNSYNFKQIVKRFIYLYLLDAVIVLRFTGYFMLNLLIIFNIPSYLTDLCVGFDSFRTGIEISRYHWDRACYYCCDFVHLLCNMRTYRVLGRSILFAFLVPSACLAELLPTQSVSTSGRFYMGVFMWISLFIAAIVAFKRCVGASSDVASTNHALLGISLAILSVLVPGLVSMSFKNYLKAPFVISSSRFSFSWSHIYAVITPILETIQLMAVVLYFYWPVPTNNYEFTGNNDNIYASKNFLWGDDHSSSKIMNDSTVLACVVVMLNGVFTTIPLAVHHKKDRITALKESPLYELVSVLFTRLFPVWIMATLMRSSSCISSASSDNGVVSTATDVHCDNHYWSSMASLPLLAYYMVTSTILHSDDLNYLQSVTAVASVSVKFSPIYASLVKIIQFATCMLCLSTFASPNSSLVLIIVCNTIAVIAPTIFGAEKSCSIAGITIFRSTGFVCVVWTAIVCIARQNSSDHYGWAIESSLWIGCGVIILVGLVLTYYLEHLRRKSWGKLTDQTELDAIITSLKNMHDEMFVEEATFGTDKTVRTDKSLIDLKWSARSPYELARSVINLERHIIADKLSHQFLISRNEWKKKVINDVIPHYFNDWVPPSTEPNPFTIQDAGVLYLDNDNFAAMEEGAPQNNTNKGSMSTELIQCLTLVDQLNVLKENIRPRSAVNVFQSTVLQLLSYKLPVDVVRHIFSFFIDSSFIAIFLDEYIQCKMEVIQGLLVDTKAGGIAVHFPLLQHYLSTRKFTQRCYQSFALASRHDFTSSPIEVAAKDKLFRACEGIDPRIPEPIKFPVDSIVQTNNHYLDNDRKKYVVVEVTYDETVLHNRYKIRIQSDPSGYLHSVSECDLLPARKNVAT